MLTKRPRTTSPLARALKAIGCLAPPVKFESPAAPRRSAWSVALSVALLSQVLVVGSQRAAAQSQPGFDVDEAATAQVVRLPAQPAGATTVSFSALSAARANSGDVTASATKGEAARFVEPPPAPPEPDAHAINTERVRISPNTSARAVADKSANKSSDKSGGVSLLSGPVTSPSPVASFQAQSDPGFVAPPDVGGAVGLDKVMSTHRSNYVVQDKAGAVLSSVPIEVFWAPTGAVNPYNPRSIYDPYNNRWLLSAVSDARSASSSILVGVSQTSDPAGAYYLFRFDADENDALWADYGSLGFNKNWVAVTFNAHNVAGNAFSEGRVLTIDYAALRAGTWSAVLFGGITGNTGFSMQPAVTYSTTEEMLYLVSHIGSAARTYVVSAVTGTASDPTLFIGEQKQLAGLGGWTQPGGETLPQAPEPNGAGARKIDSSDSRARNVVFRNGSVYYCQTVGLPAGRTAATIDRTAAQWVRLDANADFVEGGRVEDETATPTNGGKWYAYPSLSVNKFGDVMVGFTEFSSQQFPSAGYAVHVAGDAAGSTRPPFIYKAGEGYYEKTLTGTRNLWGLYSTTQVDPSNDRDIWTIQEYAAQPVGVGNNSGRWGTSWARVVPFNRAPSVSITSPASGSHFLDPATIQLAAAASDVDGQIASVEFFSGQTKIGDGVQTSPGTFTFTWTNVRAGDYTITARATDNEGAQTTSAPVTVTVLPVSVLSDDFNDNSTDATKWAVVQAPNTTVTEQNGRLEITTPTSGVGYSGYHALNAFDLTNRRATVEVPQAAYGHGADTYFVLHDRTTGRNSYVFAVGGVPGSMLMRETFNGAIASQAVIPYDAVQHRFWRIRHDPAADTVLFQTSPDGLQWTTRHAAPRRFAVNKMETRIYAGRFTTTTGSQLAVFDNYRVEDNPPSRTMLADDFNDNSRDPAKWTIDDPSNSITTAREQNQRLEIAPSPSQVGYNAFTSTNLYDFTNASAAVEVVQATAGASETYLQVAVDDFNNVITVVSGGNIIFQYSVGGARSRTFVPYNPAQHRFWRIRHDIGDDAVIWETSADNVTWAVQRTAARPIALTSVRLRLMAGKWTNTNSTNPGTAVYDNFRAERAPFEPPTDNFNDNSLDPSRWTLLYANSPVTVSEQNQRLEIALAPNVAGYNAAVSAADLNLRGKTAQVEVVQPASLAGWVETGFALRIDDNNAFLFSVGAQGSFICDARANGVIDRTQLTYNPTAHRFWRFRHNGAAHTMSFETSPDGQTWTTLKTVAVAIPLDSLKLWLYAGAWGTGNAAPGTAVFDRMKLTPNE